MRMVTQLFHGRTSQHGYGREPAFVAVYACLTFEHVAPAHSWAGFRYRCWGHIVEGARVGGARVVAVARSHSLLQMRKATETDVFVESTMQLLGRHLEVTRALGTPIEVVAPFAGEFKYDKAVGTFTVTGPALPQSRRVTRAATVHVHAVSSPQTGDLEWRYSKLDVEIPTRTGKSFVVSTTPTRKRDRSSAE